MRPQGPVLQVGFTMVTLVLSLTALTQTLIFRAQVPQQHSTWPARTRTQRYHRLRPRQPEATPACRHTRTRPTPRRLPRCKRLGFNNIYRKRPLRCRFWRCSGVVGSIRSELVRDPKSKQYATSPNPPHLADTSYNSRMRERAETSNRKQWHSKTDRERQQLV